MKKLQKMKQEFDTKAALKPEPFSLAWYILLCLTDYTFSSLGKRDLRHANSSLGMSCVTSHLLMSNPIDLPRPPHAGRRSSPPLRGFGAFISASAPPRRAAPRLPCLGTGASPAPPSTTVPRRSAGEKCPGWAISLIRSLRMRTILFFFPRS